ERAGLGRRRPVAELRRAARVDPPREAGAALGVAAQGDACALGVRRTHGAAILAARRWRAVESHAARVSRTGLGRALLLGTAGGPALGEAVLGEVTAAVLTGGRRLGRAILDAGADGGPCLRRALLHPAPGGNALLEERVARGEALLLARWDDRIAVRPDTALVGLLREQLAAALLDARGDAATEEVPRQRLASILADRRDATLLHASLDRGPEPLGADRHVGRRLVARADGLLRPREAGGRAGLGYIGPIDRPERRRRHRGCDTERERKQGPSRFHRRSSH